MTALDYLDFDLRLVASHGTFRVLGTDFAGRHARGDLRIPSSLGALELSAGEELGGRFFEALFNGRLRHIFDAALEDAERRGRGLRLRLFLPEVSELSSLPWEALYHPGQQRFLALSRATSVVRYLELPRTVRALEVPGPLAVLAVLASPDGLPALDVEREWQRLHTALADVPGIELQRLERPTLGALRQRLRRGHVHVLHFVGHGDFDESSGGGLYFETRDGAARRVSAATLGDELHGHFELRFAMLNACRGADSAARPFAGTAQKLVQRGVPAVLALRGDLRDAAGVLLAGELYGALADGDPIDACVGEARKALAAGGFEEWVAPALFLRAPDGRLFRRAEPAKEGDDAPPEPDDEEDPGFRRFLPKTARGWVAAGTAVFALLQGLVFGLGVLVTRSREGLVGLPETLSYPARDVYLAGLGTWRLALDALFALFSPDLWLAAGAWGSAALLLAPVAVSRRLAGERRRKALTLLLVMSWTVLLFALRFATAAVFPARSESAPGPVFDVALGHNLVTLTEYEAVSWLKNDSERNDQRRQALAGVVFWLLAAALASAVYAGRSGLRPGWRRGLLVGHGLLAVLLAGLVPRAQTIATRGLVYPQVTAATCGEPALERASTEPGRCVFDVSAGGRPRTLLLWGAEPGIVTLSEDRASCARQLRRKVIGDGC